MTSRTVPVRIAAAVLGLALCACERQNPTTGIGVAPPADAPRGRTGFAEEAVERGLRFSTHFLPGEQGKNFKINLYDHGSGVAIEDVDGDGDDDLYLLDQLGPNHLFRNDGGKFTDVTEGSGVALADRISVGAAFGDLDGDGDPDLYVTTTRGGNALFRNDGGFRFTDVTKAAGVELVAHSQSPLLFDHDEDGDLDVFVTNTGRWTVESFRESERYWEGVASLAAMVASEPEKNALYRNDGGLRFTEVAASTGLAGTGWDGDAIPFDYDGDGHLDVFVGNMFGFSRLMRNVGGGRYEDVTATTLGAPPWGTIGTRVIDADGDGVLDVYIADMHSDMWVGFTDAEFVQEQKRFAGPQGAAFELGRMSGRDLQGLLDMLKIPDRKLVFGSALFRGRGDGTFQDVTEAAHADTWWPWGVAAADFDLDGDEDVFLPSGMGYPWFYWRSSLLLNRGDGTFEERGRDFGVDPLPGGPFNRDELGGAKSFRCAAVADFDGDGRPDVVANAFNGRVHLWMNRFPAKRWVGVRLAATKGPREAMGAVVRVKAAGRTQTRLVQPVGGYLSQSTRTLYFGIGDADRAESVEIAWPGRPAQTVTGLEAGRVHVVTEPK